MTRHTALHDTFTIERTFTAPPAKVFAAWSTPEAKGRWFSGPAGWKPVDRSLDFRVGGREKLHGRFQDGKEVIFNAQYQLIEKDARIIYLYDMVVGGKQISISLGTIELTAEGDGTRLVYTEQGVYFDGAHGATSREEGTAALFDKLSDHLKG